MVLEQLGYIKMAKNHFFDEKSQRLSLQLPPVDMIRMAQIGTNYMLKNPENIIFLA